MRWDLAKESNDVTQWINLAAVFGSGTFCGKSNEELQEITKNAPKCLHFELSFAIKIDANIDQIRGLNPFYSLNGRHKHKYSKTNRTN